MLKRKVPPLGLIGHRLYPHIYSTFAVSANVVQNVVENTFFEDLKKPSQNTCFSRCRASSGPPFLPPWTPREPPKLLHWLLGPWRPPRTDPPQRTSTSRNHANLRVKVDVWSQQRAPETHPKTTNCTKTLVFYRSKSILRLLFSSLSFFVPARRQMRTFIFTRVLPYLKHLLPPKALQGSLFCLPFCTPRASLGDTTAPSPPWGVQMTPSRRPRTGKYVFFLVKCVNFFRNIRIYTENS